MKVIYKIKKKLITFLTTYFQFFCLNDIYLGTPYKCRKIWMIVLQLLKYLIKFVLIFLIVKNKNEKYILHKIDESQWNCLSKEL